MPASPAKRVLAVEDDPECCQLFRLIVEDDFGARLIVANDGVEALDYLRAFKPDLILLDLILPKVDGFHLCRVLKSTDLTRDIPVIVVSAAPRPEMRTRALDAGADYFVHKLYDFDHLWLYLANFLQDSESG